MKKSLIAIAALAVVGSAAAQSSLNLYGVADVYVGKAKGVSAAAGTDGLASSRIGFKGSEDLGAGLKANFNFEQYLNLANGATNNPTAGTGQTFDRQANVGFSGGFGTIKLGRSFTAFDDINGAANSGFDSALSATSGVWVGYAGSSSAQIYYATPDLNGLSGAVGFNLKGNKATNDITSMHLKYSSGPIYVGVAYQDEKTTAATASNAANTSIKHTLVNGSYDLGMAKLLASYRIVKNPNLSAPPVGYIAYTGRQADEYQFGVDVPVSSSLTLSAGYANSEVKATNAPLSGKVRKSAGYSLAAGYSLSKRTMLYGGLNANKTNGVKNNLVAAGINHSF